MGESIVSHACFAFNQLQEKPERGFIISVSLGLWVEVGGKAVPNRCITPVGCFAIKEDVMKEARNNSGFSFTRHRALQKAFVSPLIYSNTFDSIVLRNVPPETHKSNPAAYHQVFHAR